jgi:hypothetical protein
MVVFEFQEHYSNLTLKTALMLQWLHRRCPHAGAVFKTDDDVLLNPWRMREVLIRHKDKQLIGDLFLLPPLHVFHGCRKKRLKV